MKKGVMLLVFLTVILSIPLISAIEQNREFKDLITGNVVFSTNPNNLQEIYSKSLPSLVKINVYYDYDIFIPKLKSISFKSNFNYEYSSYESLNVVLDNNINAFEDFFGDSFWQEYPLGDYYYFDEMGVQYVIDITREDIALAKEGFSQTHESNLPFSSGTGFFVDSNGYILTNAHVATLVDTELEQVMEDIRFENYLLYYYELYDNAEYNENIPLEDYDDIVQKTLFLEQNLEISNLRVNKIEVIWGEGSNVKKYPAELIDSNQNYLEEIGGRDWALIKVNGQSFPSLSLGDSNSVSIGEDIVVIGYPWTSEGFSEDLENYVAPTPTYGKISNVVLSGAYKDIQIDISIEGGNSGGPGLNSNGEVIGIATSGYSSLGGTYNYLTPINDIKEETSLRFKQSEVDTLWEESLENFWIENYITSKEKIKELSSLSPSHPYTKEFTNQLNRFPNSNNVISVENDPTLLNKSNISTASWSLIFLGVIITGLLIFIVIKLSQKKK